MTPIQATRCRATSELHDWPSEESILSVGHAISLTVFTGLSLDFQLFTFSVPEDLRRNGTTSVKPPEQAPGCLN